MMKGFLIVAWVFFSGIAVSQAQNYSVAQIPAELKGVASAVVREDERQIIINAENNMLYRIKRVVTILDKEGDDFSRILVSYNKSRKIKKLNLSVYNEFGLEVAKIKQSEFRDESFINDFSLFEDDRVKKYNVSIAQYPITIALEFELQMNQTLFIPDWFPQPADDVSVQQASIALIKNKSFEIKYSSQGLGDVEQTAVDDKKEMLRWTIQNIAAKKLEPFSRNKEEILPSLRFSPVKFTYEGLSGTYTDWKSYGLWVHNNLLKGRSELSPTTQAFVKDLIKDAPNKKEAAKLIYQYAQKKNRYISVQIGIGGFMPMKATEVDALSYGDCKALSNYMMALLRVAEIPSYYTEVHAGDSKISLLENFASGGQGNHIILCVPFEDETVWLECTSKEAPFGYLGSFTQDRNVLVIKEDGGYITRTPLYSWDGNLQERTADFTLAADGKLSGAVKTIFTGLQSDNRRDADFSSTVEKETYLKELFPLPNLNMEKYQLDKDINHYPKKEEFAQLVSYGYANLRGSFCQFDLNPLNISKRQLKEISDRGNEVSISFGYTDVDSLTFKIPAHFKVENLPIQISQAYDFGTYEFKAELVGADVRVWRKMVVKEGNYPAAKYNDLVSFYKTAYRYDRAKCMLKKVE